MALKTQTAIQTGPLGKKTTTVDTSKKGRVKTLTEATTLTKDQQRLLKGEEKLGRQALSRTTGALERAAKVSRKPFDLSGLPRAPKASDAVRQRVEDALYQREVSRLDPQFADRQRALETQLVNSGFSRGSEGYTKALADFGRTQNDAYQTAMESAIGAGGTEQSRLFGLQSVARQQALQELLTKRQQPFNEMNAFAGVANGGATIPQYNSPVGDLTNSSQFATTNKLNQQAQQQQQQTSLWNSIFNLGGNLLGGWLGGGGGGLF